MKIEFTNVGKEELSIDFHLFSQDEFRVKCNGNLLSSKENIPYTFPAGIIHLEVYEKGNFLAPFFNQCAFFPPLWKGCFLVKKEGIQAFPEESFAVLPEKGHFRVINLLKETVTVRRMGGTEIFTDIEAVSPYRLAGEGKYRLQFFSTGEKIGERELLIKEGSRGSLIIKKERIEYIEEFSI